MKAVEDTITFADDSQRDQFVKAILIHSQLLESPIEESVLRDKLAGVAPETWHLELLRILKEFAFKAKWLCYDPQEKPIEELSLPFIARVNGSFVVLIKRNDKQVLFFSIEQKRPMVLPMEEFRQQWDGYAFFMTPKLKLDKLPKRFNLQWFLPVFWKFRRFFYEVLAASCLLQVFTLITPLFTQVIIDKVLVHKGLSTLDVLMTGLIIIAIFQMV